MKTVDHRWFKTANKLVSLLALIACTIFLTGCPNAKFISVKQPAIAATNSLVTVDVQFSLDDTTSGAGFHVEIPEGFKMLDAYFPEISSSELFFFELEFYSMGCGDLGNYYPTSHLANRLTLDSGSWLKTLLPNHVS